MDVSNASNELNEVKDNTLALKSDDDGNIETTLTDATDTIRNINYTVKVKGKMQAAITAIMIALFCFIVVYCLVMQLWWVLGVLALPLLRKAMLKIIDRYV